MADASHQYQQAYSESSFQIKVKRFSLAAGREVIEKALILYYTLREPNVPTWAKTTITAALGYFILPADAILDLMPGAGYADDLGVLMVALAIVAMHVTPEAKRQASEILQTLFGDRAGTLPDKAL
jgi:uncharacterized membrane protein YkvA (DUF1232 family)